MKNTNNISALIAAASLALAGVAMAQSTDVGKNAPTSTPGAGCTATANAMKGGNLGGRASNIACGNSDSAGTTANATTSAAPMTGSTTQTTMSNSTSTAGAAPSTVSSDTASTASATPAPVRRAKRVARADRG